MSNKGKTYEEAKKIAQGKVSFIRHFITYLAVIIVLAVINNVTSRGHQWWLWVAGFWGIGILFNFLSAFVFKGGGLKNLEEEFIKKEMGETEPESDDTGK